MPSTVGRKPNTRSKPPKGTKRERRKKAVQVTQTLVALKTESVAGQPTTYDPAMCDLVKPFAELGATDYEIAQALGVTLTSIRLWQVRHQEFAEAMRRGKDAADARVERSLWEKANGYTYTTQKVHVDAEGNVTRVEVIEHVPPSDGAMKMWLTNRKPNDWKERNTVEFDPDAPLNINVLGGLPKT